MVVAQRGFLCSTRALFTLCWLSKLLGMSGPNHSLSSEREGRSVCGGGALWLWEKGECQRERERNHCGGLEGNNQTLNALSVFRNRRPESRVKHWVLVLFPTREHYFHCYVISKWLNNTKHAHQYSLILLLSLQDANNSIPVENGPSHFFLCVVIHHF